MAVSDYNFFSGLGDNKKAQGALVGGALIGGTIVYLATKNNQ